jgi:hypothetical protein
MHVWVAVQTLLGAITLLEKADEYKKKVRRNTLRTERKSEMCNGVVQLLGWCSRDRPQGFSFSYRYAFTRHLRIRAANRHSDPSSRITNKELQHSGEMSCSFSVLRGSETVSERSVRGANNTETKNAQSQQDLKRTINLLWHLIHRLYTDWYKK